MQLRVSVEGDAALLLANNRLANPLDPATIERKKFEVVYKRDKTEENLLRFMDAEWTGHLYYDPAVGIVIERKMIQATMIKAAKQFKKQGKRGSIAADLVPLLKPHGGAAIKLPGNVPSKTEADIAALQADPKYRLQCLANVNGSTVLKARPLMPEGWTAILLFDLDDNYASVASMETIIEVFLRMGRGGFGDWRPTSPTPGEYGTFLVVKVEKSKDGKKWESIKF